MTVVDAAADDAAAELAELEDQAASFARDSRTGSTWWPYQSDAADFCTWRVERVSPVEPLPATCRTGPTGCAIPT